MPIHTQIHPNESPCQPNNCRHTTPTHRFRCLPAITTPYCFQQRGGRAIQRQPNGGRLVQVHFPTNARARQLARQLVGALQIHRPHQNLGHLRQVWRFNAQFGPPDGRGGGRGRGRRRVGCPCNKEGNRVMRMGKGGGFCTKSAATTL